MRCRPSDESGFSIVEILVVMIVMAILAMIALPSFIGQRSRAEDTEAQAMIRTAQVALHTYRTEHDDFDASRAELEQIEPALREATRAFRVTAPTATTYRIRERSESGTTFTLTRNSDGTLRRTCNVAGHGLCRTRPDSAGNRW